MGFFGDLKQDLSQAVNELIPDEEQNNTSPVQEGPLSLDAMLENIDSVQISEEMVSEENVPGQEMGETSAESETAQSGKLEATGISGYSKMTEPAEVSAQAAENVIMEEKSEMADVENMLENMISAEKPVEEDVREEKEEDNKGAEKIMEAYPNRTVSDETSVITAGMTITGDIVSEGSVEVIGNVNGNIDVLGKLNITGHVNGNSKASEIYAESAKINGEIKSEGAVKIGASTVIIGNITAVSASIAGAVKGDIDVKGPVVLDASAIVMGNIKSKSVQINNGAVIEGMCSQCYADISPSAFFDDYKGDKKKAK